MARWSCGLLISLWVGAAALAGPKPAFTFDSVLGTYFDDESGLISFTQYDLAFAPEGKLNAQVAVTDKDGTVIKSFPFFADYKTREGVFARAQVQGPADITLTEPGVYNIIFVVDGEPATRLPVVLEQTSAGDDPFDPQKKYQFYGLWQSYAVFTMQRTQDITHPEVAFWVGGRDLAKDASRDMFFATLKRDGEVIGHSQRTLGTIAAGHYKRATTTIYRPHSERQTPNAVLLPISEWSKDGKYELIVTRKSDDAVIRRFAFEAKGGEIQELPNVKLGFEPRVDYIAPRAQKRGSTAYEFVEAVWIKTAETE